MLTNNNGILDTTIKRTKKNTINNYITSEVIDDESYNHFKSLIANSPKLCQGKTHTGKRYKVNISLRKDTASLNKDNHYRTIYVHDNNEIIAYIGTKKYKKDGGFIFIHKLCSKPGTGEGSRLMRMILADALAYSKKYDPELVIDAATLTGSAVAAIGTKASCIMGNASDKVFAQLDKAGNEEHERVVRLPFWDEYYEEVKSKVADLKNLGGPYAGMITAGKFLEHFVKAPYVHIDIAGPAWLDAPENYKGQGGTGVGVRLIYNFLKNYK